MDRRAEDRLVEGAEALGVPLSAASRAAFGRYFELLVRWNAKIKLTSVTDPLGVVEKHFLDSLAVVPAVRGAADLVDVGAGPGFPGVVVAMMEREMPVVLVESIQKKAAFLEALKRELGLPRVEVVADRMEQVITRGRRFAAAVSRATFAPEEWIARGQALVAPGGRLVAMVVPESVPAAAGALETLAPDWRRTWEAAELQPPYAAGRALAVFRGRRSGSG